MPRCVAHEQETPSKNRRGSGFAQKRCVLQSLLNRLLSNNTKVHYTGINGINLPESYNGLGTRNIILILLQLRDFHKQFLATTPRPCTHLVFIEEPEVHLHPQMQEVFIRKLTDIAKDFGDEAGIPWPVQFVVSTHSSHVANEAHFETIRYFIGSKENPLKAPQTKIKDLCQGLSGKSTDDKKFLHQYMTLTRCDLFFADKAILIEGTTERLLLPRIIKQVDIGLTPDQKLSSQYLSIVEVGGAYAHLFFDLLDFLELKSLIISDIDAVKPNESSKLVACPVSEGTATSNACIKSWFNGVYTDLKSLHVVNETQKVKNFRRIAFQTPETLAGPCGRSFEDAFMLANPTLFQNSGVNDDSRARIAWEEAKDLKKSEFAFNNATRAEPWQAPKYITEGLIWLASVDHPQTAATSAPVEVVPAANAATPNCVTSASAS